MSARRKTSKKKVKRTKLNPIPPGRRILTPYLIINDTSRAMAFYKDAFGARELNRETAPDGNILHASLKIGDSIVMMSDEFPGAYARSPSSLGGSTGSIHIYSKNVDKLLEKAVSAGAKSVMPLDNMFWGERYGVLADPFGHYWSVSMRIKMSLAEMEEKKKAAMAMFAGGEHPGQSS